MTWALRAAGAMVLVAGSTCQASAQTQQLVAINKAANNIAHEYTQCSAYFLVVSVAMENSGKPELAAQYERVSQAAFDYASGFAEVAGLLPETTQARYEMEFVAMADRIAGNTSNLSILGKDYADTCLVAMEDMDSRVDFWMDKEGLVR